MLLWSNVYVSSNGQAVVIRLKDTDMYYGASHARALGERLIQAADQAERGQVPKLPQREEG